MMGTGQLVLGTGLSGTIGRFLAGRVSALGVRLESSLGRLTFPNAPFALIHAAAIVGELSVRKDLALSRRVNIDATLELARAAYRSRCSKFIFVSTSHVYETSAPGTLLSEESPVLPRGHYPLQKLLAEELLREVFADQPERLIIARVFSIIDDAQPSGTLGGAIRALSAGAIASLPNASDERDFLTPKQAADVLIGCAQSHDIHGVVNVCSGTATTVGTVAKLMLGSRRFQALEDRILEGISNAPSIVGANYKLREYLPSETSDLADEFRESIQNVFAT